MMKRRRRQGAGLLDLPEEVLALILSILGPLSLAAIRLACRALRDAATRSRRRVVIGSGDHFAIEKYSCTYTATANASPRVLQLMHTFQSLLDGLDEAEAKQGWSADTKGRPPRHIPVIRLFLKTRLLKSVAGAVLTLKIGQGWFSGLADDLAEEGLQLRPEVLVHQMRQLQSLHLETEEHWPALRELSALRHLTDLQLGFICEEHEIQEVCSTLALSRSDFNVGYLDEDGEDPVNFGRVLDMLVSGKTSALRELGMDFLSLGIFQVLSRLTALTALTALTLRSAFDCLDLSGVASVTGLKSLCVVVLHLYERLESDPDDWEKTLSPLTALTGLTLLDLRGISDGWCVPLSDVSALSALTALRVLRCHFLDEAELVAGDPLPVQLRFLRSAPALEELDLCLDVSFCNLPNASSLGVREAVRGLLSLTQVAICIGPGKLQQYYPPLSAFAAAPSIETLSFRADGPNPRWPGDTTAHARDCFKALTRLRSLSLAPYGSSGTGRVPRVADLLAGLPSTHLTFLSLDVGAAHNPRRHERLVQEIVRFRDLRSLSLAARDEWSASLDELCGLKCLTRLEVIAARQPVEQSVAGRACGDSSSLGGRVTHVSWLAATIREYGNLVGFPVEMVRREGSRTSGF